MPTKPDHEAAIPNPALKPLSALVGKWRTVGTHPLVPGVTFHGHTSFEWIEGGAFLLMHSEIDEPGIPSGVAVFGSDDSADVWFMLYFDERGVSRKPGIPYRRAGVHPGSLVTDVERVFGTTKQIVIQRSRIT
jgi:hypothetical protein